MTRYLRRGGVVAIALGIGVVQPGVCLRAQVLCAVNGESGEVVYTNSPPTGRCSHPVLLSEPVPFTPAAGGTDSRLRPWIGAIGRQANAWGVSQKLVQAVVAQESGGNPLAVSRKGALGLMQLMPATAKRFSVRDPLDPEQNIAGGVQYLSTLLDRYGGDVRLALAAYNAGEGAVDRNNGVPPYRETRDYVRRILERTGSRGGRVRPRADASVSAVPPAAPASKDETGAPRPAAPRAAPIEAVRGPDGVLRFEN